MTLRLNSNNDLEAGESFVKIGLSKIKISIIMKDRQI